MGSAKDRQMGPLPEQNNRPQGRSGSGTPTRRRRIDKNPVKSGGINEATAGNKGKGFV